MALYVKGNKEPLLTNSLVLAAASPFLNMILKSLNHCDGCSNMKTIILAEEQKDTVEALLELLHAKHLKQASGNLIHKTPEFEELCRRLMLSRPASDEEGDRNDKEIEVPQLRAAEAPTDESQNILASKDAYTDELSKQSNRNNKAIEMQPLKSHETEDQPKNLLAPTNTTICSNKPSLFLPQRRSSRQRYPVNRIPSSSEKVPAFEKSRRKKLLQKKRHRYNCGNCLGCARDEDCGECDLCPELHNVTDIADISV